MAPKKRSDWRRQIHAIRVTDGYFLWKNRNKKTHSPKMPTLCCLHQGTHRRDGFSFWKIWCEHHQGATTMGCRFSLSVQELMVLSPSDFRIRGYWKPEAQGLRWSITTTTLFRITQCRDMLPCRILLIYIDGMLSSKCQENWLGFFCVSDTADRLLFLQDKVFLPKRHPYKGWWFNSTWRCLGGLANSDLSAQGTYFFKSLFSW